METSRQRKITWLVLLAIAVCIFLIRLEYIGDDDMFSTDSYYHIRQIEHIRSHGVPMYEDAQSSFTKLYAFTPLYHYLMAVFLTFFSAHIVFKIIPILISLLNIPAMYLLLAELLRDKRVAYIGAATAGLLPGIVLTSTNSINPMTLFVPLFLLVLYSLHKVRFNMSLQYILIIASIAAALTHVVFAAIVVGIYVYFIIMFLMNKKIYNVFTEYIFFITLFILWVYSMIYKQYLNIYGIDLLTLNLPQTLRASMFPDISISLVLSAISIVLIMVGAYGVYRKYKSGEELKVNLLIALTITFITFMYLKLVPFGLGVVLLSVVVIPLACLGIEDLDRYIKKTHLKRLAFPVLVTWALLLVLTVAIPSLYFAEHGQSQITQSEHDAFIWLREYSKPDATIFVAPATGQSAAYLAQRKIFFDDMFLGFPQLDEFNRDIINSATMSYGLESVKIFKNVTYIVDTPRLQSYIGEEFTMDTRLDCMEQVKTFGSSEDLSYARIIFNRCDIR